MTTEISHLPHSMRIHINMTNTTFVNVTQAAEMLGITPAQIYRMIAAGQLTAYRPTPHKTKLIKSEIDERLTRVVVPTATEN
jgi:excisionase family DNA binding protein